MCIYIFQNTIDEGSFHIIIFEVVYFSNYAPIAYWEYVEYDIRWVWSQELGQRALVLPSYELYFFNYNLYLSIYYSNRKAERQ